MVTNNNNSTMAAKIESPSSSSKVSSTDRLARKRAAARLRQQRCRARKRQAMLERRRCDDNFCQFGSQDSTVEPTNVVVERCNPPFPVSKSKEVPSSSSNGPIYNCVSFDSSRSSEDAQRSSLSPPQIQPRSPTKQIMIPPATLPPQKRKAIEVVTASKDQPKDSLVAEEEAAVAAMLSLKAGGATNSPSPSTPVTPPSSSHHVGTKPTSKPTTFRYYGEWERYEPYGYGRHGCAPTYYMGMPQRVPPPQYRYYPTFPKGYSRFNYE